MARARTKYVRLLFLALARYRIFARTTPNDSANSQPVKMSKSIEIQAAIHLYGAPVAKRIGVPVVANGNPRSSA